MTLPIQALIQPDELNDVLRPIAEARGMPNAVYTAGEAYSFERDHLFAPHWTAVAFADSLAPGEARAVDFMGLPILLTRQKTNGEIRVFHNVCSHRGLRLVSGSRQTNDLLVCPYHSWTYRLDGQLKATPHIGGVDIHHVDGFCRADHGLKPIRHHVWLGVLFVNLDGNAPPFETSVATVLNRYRNLMGPEGESQLRRAVTHDGGALDVNCNWKLAMENFLEAYHLPFIHPGLNSYSPLNRHHNRVIDELCAGQVTTSFDPGLDREDPLPLFGGWDPDRLATGEYPALFPNLMLGFQASHVFAMIVSPTSPDTCREEFMIFYAGDEANEDRYLRQRKSNLDAWTAVFYEDIEPCERMQTGRNSPGFRGGAFSPVHDVCSHHFHQWVAKHYLGALDDRPLGRPDAADAPSRRT